MKITMDGKYKTRDGRDVRILCVDRPDPLYPIVALVDDNDVFCFMSSGGYLQSMTTHYLDIIEVRDRVPDDTPVDAKIWVSNDNVHWWREHFAGNSTQGTSTYKHGTTSHSMTCGFSHWNYSTLTEPKS